MKTREVVQPHQDEKCGRGEHLTCYLPRGLSASTSTATLALQDSRPYSSATGRPAGRPLSSYTISWTTLELTLGKGPSSVLIDAAMAALQDLLRNQILTNILMLAIVSHFDKIAQASKDNSIKKVNRASTLKRNVKIPLEIFSYRKIPPAIFYSVRKSTHQYISITYLNCPN